MIGAIDIAKPIRSGNPFGRKIDCLPESSHYAMNEIARVSVADKADEIASTGIEEIERKRILLRAFLVRVTSQHLERDHTDQIIACFGTRARVVIAAHLLRSVTVVLFVGEG